MLVNRKEEHKTKLPPNHFKVTYKPIIKNLNFDYDRSKQNHPNFFVMGGEYLRAYPQSKVANIKYEKSLADVKLPKRPSNANSFNHDTKPIANYKEYPEKDELNQHKRVISLFRMRCKKNQMFLPRQKTTEAAAIDSFMFSFYNPKKAQPAKAKPQQNVVPKAYSATYDNRYNSNKHYYYN